MEKYSSKIRNSLKDELWRLLWTSFGVFLFILFFQPFPLLSLSENDRLLFVTGFGAISFVLACLVLIIIPLLWANWFKISEWETGPPVLLVIILLGLTSTAFAFYIRYVGSTYLTLYIMFKVVLVCLLPIIILIILYKNKSLERRIEILLEQTRNNNQELKVTEKSKEDVEIEVYSENKSDKLSVRLRDIVFIKSADNYIEIFYVEHNLLEKKILRGTLKNIEIQLSGITSFVRCHRTCIVNMNFVEQLTRGYNGYSIKMKYFEEKIAVSRQYIQQIKNVISVKI